MSKLKLKTRWFPALMNLIGLGIAFSIFLILLSQVWWDYRYDRFPGSKNVYVVEMPSFHDGLYRKVSYRPVIQMVADCSPDIALVCDYYEERNADFGYIRLKGPEGEFEEIKGIDYANTETSVLDMFNVTLLTGRREDFTKKGDVLISESTAKRFFPDKDPMGEPIQYLSFNGIEEGRIVGIYKDRKANESLINGFLIHEGEDDLTFPNHNLHAGYIKLNPGADLAAVREAVGKIELGRSIKDMRITQIHDTWFEKDLDHWGVKVGGNKRLCLILTAIAVLFLCIAGFNYINFEMASMPFRIKDINTRKVFGASRKTLILKQLARSSILVGCAFVVGVLAMRTIGGTSWGSFLSWNLSAEKNIPVICIGAAAAIVLALVAGIIPALYSTSFQPALVLKGSFATSVKGGGWRTATVLLQFVLSFLFFICALVLQRQTSFMVNNRDLGFDYDRVLKVESNVFGSLGEVEARIRDIPGVEDVTSGASPMKEGFGSMSEVMDADKVTKYTFYYIQPEYPAFFHFGLVDGRLPIPGETDVALVNESFVESAPSFGPGKTINALGDEKYTVIGILKNFHARSLENDYSPLAYFVGGMRGAYGNSFMIRIEPLANAAEILQKARSIYSEMKDIPEEEIEAGFLTQDIKKLYEHEIRQTRLMQLSSILSLIITLIGILGVVWLDTRFMRKEIAIRKVNGATKREILRQVGWKYLIIAIVGFIIAAPIAYAIGNRWLQQFAFRTNIPAWLFVVAFVVIIVITMVTVILQAWQAASANPVDAIKNE